MNNLEWYNVELNKEDTRVLKAYLKQNKIYYECSQINNNFFHIEIQCSYQECKFINDFIDKYIY